MWGEGGGGGEREGERGWGGGRGGAEFRPHLQDTRHDPDFVLYEREVA